MDIKEKKYIFISSGTSRVLEFLNLNFFRQLFLIDDLTANLELTYTSIRTILCNLCDDDIILRVCRGVYYYPSSTHTDTYPSAIDVLKYLSVKGNYSICPMGDFLEYCLGIREVFPTNITCYTTGKIKTLKLYNKTQVKLIPRKRNVFMGICPWNVMLLAQYIADSSTAIEKNILLLSLYIKKESICSRDIINLPDEIKKKILILMQ
jgi:hypothetical protein